MALPWKFGDFVEGSKTYVEGFETFLPGSKYTRSSTLQQNTTARSSFPVLEGVKYVELNLLIYSNSSRVQVCKRTYQKNREKIVA